ncbi:hypothetical protein RJT34_12102 [Clitoria ternatea]|uniref:Prolamin-like domain-containing protein n=1 Tax=Clitoria ternatea TaxID=43366 RepID=A0AAN9JN35_CLITE
MATFNILCLVVSFLASATLLVRTGFSYEASEPSEGPAIEENYAQTPLSPQERYLVSCMLMLHPPCDELYIFGTMFIGNGAISKDCCHSIVHDMGKYCHDSWIREILKSPKFIATFSNRTQVLERANQVWNMCSHPSAQLDDGLARDGLRLSSTYEKNYLEDCAGKLHSNCGSQIYYGTFFGNVTISNDCCHSLVHDLGKPCNDKLTKFVVRSPQYKQNETQILYRSNKIWTDCTLVDHP